MKTKLAPFQIDGPIESSQIFLAVADVFGMDPEELSYRDRNIIQQIIELVSERIQSHDEKKIVKKIADIAREYKGDNPHLSVYRMLQMARKE